MICKATRLGLVAPCLIVGLALRGWPGVGAAQEKKDAPKVAVGTFEPYKDEVLTLTVDGKKQEWKVPGATTCATGRVSSTAPVHPRRLVPAV